MNVRLALVLAFFGACSPSVKNQDATNASKEVGTEGGTLSLANGIEVAIPAGALDAPVTIAAKLVTDISAESWTDLPSDLGTVGGAVVLTPHGTTFKQPVTVRIPVTIAGDEVVLLRLANELSTEWEAEGPVTVADGFAEFKVDHFSVYSVAAVLAGGCPCFSGADLLRYAALHAARPGAKAPEYGFNSQYKNTTVVYFGQTDRIIAQDITSTVGGCGLSPRATDAPFSLLEAYTTPSQTKICSLLLASKFKGKLDGAQLVAVATGLPADGTVKLNVLVNNVTTTFALANDALTWAPALFTLGASYALSVSDAPNNYMCVLKDTVATGTFSAVPVGVQVQCITGMTVTDTDGDGTPNTTDGCPSDPLKTAAGQCGCGATDLDSDGDVTADCTDACDNNANKIAAGQCGCSGVETDSDSDGTADCNDACASNPNKIAAGQCGCGGVETDSDSDGTADCNDGCDSDPNKIAPGQCDCGTADTDTDIDGTADCTDGCDSDPNKIAPGQCNCGVADTDADMDMTAACNDSCDNDVNKTAPGVCGCMVSDVDSDLDGTPNCNDNCPGDINKLEPGVCGCGVADADVSPMNGRPDCQDLQTLIAPKDYDAAYAPTGPSGPKSLIGLAAISTGTVATWFDNAGALQATRMDSTLTLSPVGITGGTGWQVANPSGGRIAPPPASGGNAYIQALPDLSGRVLVTYGRPFQAPLQFSLFQGDSPELYVYESGTSVITNVGGFAASGYRIFGRNTENNFGFFYSEGDGIIGHPFVLKTKLFKGKDLTNPLNIATHAFTSTTADLLYMSEVGAQVGYAWADIDNLEQETLYFSIATLSGFDPANASSPTNQFAASFIAPVPVESFDVSGGADRVLDLSLAHLASGAVSKAILAYIRPSGEGVFMVVDTNGATVVSQVPFGESVQRVKVTALPGFGAALVYLGEPIGGGTLQLYALSINTSGVVVRGPNAIPAGHNPSGELRRQDQFVCAPSLASPPSFIIGTSSGSSPDHVQRVSLHR